MTYLEDLSNNEKDAIEELRKRAQNYLPRRMLEDAVLLYRFLKARDFDVDKAENMLRKHLNWRKHYQIDTILEEFTPRPFFEKFAKLSHIGVDKNGNLIKYIPSGKLEARDLMRCAQLNEYMKYWAWHFEEINAHVKKLNAKSNKVVRITVIVNLDKLTFANATNKASLDICVRTMHLLQDNYPECMNAMYIINAPSYFAFIFSILKPLMSNAMIEKIHVYSYSGWKEKLLETIDADVLPAFLGGNRTDSDGNPLCTTFITQGGRIPEMYYLPEKERDFSNKSLVKQIRIPPKQKKEISVHVAESGSQIHWEFLIKTKDVGFGIFCKLSESELQEVLSIERYDTIDGVEKGFYKFQSKGNYIVIFDNSHSWLNAKEIDYSITVLNSNNEVNSSI